MFLCCGPRILTSVFSVAATSDIEAVQTGMAIPGGRNYKTELKNWKQKSAERAKPEILVPTYIWDN